VQAGGSDVADLVRKARTTADPDQRQQLLLQAQRAVLEQALWQPLLVQRITFAVDGTCVQGERRSPYGELLFHDADTRRWPLIFPRRSGSTKRNHIFS